MTKAIIDNLDHSNFRFNLNVLKDGRIFQVNFYIPISYLKFLSIQQKERILHKAFLIPQNKI